MRSQWTRFTIIILLSAASLSVYGQDILTRRMVYEEPAMSKVTAREGIIFRTIHDTTLTFDIYFPPGFNVQNKVPLVIFNNGVGSMDIPQWQVYRDWSKLMAANGIIAVTHQARPGQTLSDGEVLIDHLIANEAKYGIDATKIGVWTCSANARTGMRLAHKTRPNDIKALVVYYGNPDSLGHLRQDLPTLLVSAGLDAQTLNMGIDNFVAASLQQDTRLQLVNYLQGIHAFDLNDRSPESLSIIRQTVDFFKKTFANPVNEKRFILTNRNFMWMIMSGRTEVAVDEFRKARTMYRADSSFHPFYNAVIREDVLNANAYFLLSNNRVSEAQELFRLLVESYPESANAHDSLSEFFERAGNKSDAIKHAQLSLEKLASATNMNENTKQRIKRGAEERIKRLQ